MTGDFPPDLDKLLSGITEANRHGEFPMGQVEEAQDELREKAEAVIDAFYDPLDLDDTSWLDRYGDRLIQAIAEFGRAERERATRVQIEKNAVQIDEAAQLRRKRAAEVDYDPDHTIAIKVAHELEFVAAAIRSQLTGG